VAKEFLDSACYSRDIDWIFFSIILLLTMINGDDSSEFSNLKMVLRKIRANIGQKIS